MKSLKYWLTISFITFLLLVFIELFIRICFPNIQPEGCDKKLMQDFVYGPSMGLVPNSQGVFFGKMIYTDQNRGRGNKHFFNKKKHSWLHLGDSVTMGVGVDDDSTFSALMAAEIDSLNILNPSLIGYSIIDYKNVVEHLIVHDSNALKISHITLFYCLNDIYHLPFKKEPSSTYYFFEFLKTHYRTYIALKGIFFNRPKSIYEYDKSFYTKDSKELKKVVNTIIQIQELCVKNHIALNVVVMPYLSQLNAAERPTKEYKILSEALNKNNNNPPSLMDASTAFKKEDDYKKYYLYGDGIHFSSAGHLQIKNYYMKNGR